MRKLSCVRIIAAIAALCLFTGSGNAADFSVGTPAATHTTLAAAIEAADRAAGHDTITLAPGTYAGNVTITEPGLTIVGTAATVSVASGTGIIILTNDVTLEGLRVIKTGSLAGNGIDIAGTATRSDITLKGVSVSNFASGLRVTDTTTVDGLTVTDSHFDANTFGWYLAKSPPNTSTVTAVSVTSTTFNDNGSKGIYAEKLEHAVFTDIAVVNSGTDLVTWPPSNGVDINLKWSAYSDITIQDSLFQNGGLYTETLQGKLDGVLVIKARNDGSYASPAATLTNVKVLNNTFVADHPLSIVGLRLGEPAKNNAGPTGFTMSGNTFSGYTTPFLNTTQSSVSASMVRANTFSGASVFLRRGSDAPAVYTQIQQAVTAASSGDVIEVNAGAYTGNQTLATANVTLAGATGAKLTGQITLSAQGTRVEGMEITNPGGNNGIVISGVGDVTLANNNIHHIGTNAPVASHVHGIRFADGAAAPAAVGALTITGNLIADIGNPANVTATNKGIYIGDSNHRQPIAGLNISGNQIRRVRASNAAFEAGGRGAYGILINHGVNTALANNAVVIADNVIDDLSGFWVHGIGLEGNTPGAQVTGNLISALAATKMAPLEDEIGVFFEANPGAATSTVHDNSFATDIAYGVHVHANLLPLRVDAERNYWGAQAGPAAGADAGEGVDFTPWYTNAAKTARSDSPGTIQIVNQPGSTQTGQALGTAVVRLLDAVGNHAAGVEVAAAPSSGTFSSGAATATTNAGGIATFNNLVIATSGTFTLNFTASGFTPVSTASFVITTPAPEPDPTTVEPPPPPFEPPPPASDPVPPPPPPEPPTPEPEQPEVPTPEAVEDIIGTIVIPTFEGGASISSVVVNAVSQAATATTELATGLATNIAKVNTDVALDALDAIGSVISVSSNAVNGRNGDSTTAAAVVASGTTALNNFSALLEAIDTKANSGPVPAELTPVQKTAVQDATIEATASVIRILNAAPQTESKGELLENLGRIISSNVNLGVPLTNAQTATLLTLTETSTAPAADPETQLATSVPLTPYNKELISKSLLVEALANTGVSSAELDSFLTELAQAINPADVNVGGTSGEQALAAGFAEALPDTGGSISFDAVTGVTSFTIGDLPVISSQPGRTLHALSAARTIPARVVSSNIVASTFPDGLTLKNDGTVIITSKRIATVVIPASHDPINLYADLRPMGVVMFDNSGNLTLVNPDTGLRFSSTFDYRGLVTGGAARRQTALTPSGGNGNESAVDYFYTVNYRDGSSQVIQPFVEADGFVESVRSRGASIATNRNTGVVTIEGIRFRPAYFVAKHDIASRAAWNAGKDARGLAYRQVDANGDGLSDYQILSSAGVQLAYRLAR